MKYFEQEIHTRTDKKASVASADLNSFCRRGEMVCNLGRSNVQYFPSLILSSIDIVSFRSSLLLLLSLCNVMIIIVIIIVIA